MRLQTPPWRGLMAALAAGAVLGLSACGGSDADAPGGDQQAAAPAPEPEAQGPVGIAGGRSTLRLDGGVQRLLSIAGVDLEATGDARETDGRFEIPITGGEVDLREDSGQVDHGGGLRFRAGAGDLEATALRLEARSGRVTAEVGGSRIPVLSVDFAGARLSEGQDAVVLPAQPARLSDDAVALLNQQIGISLLEGGFRLGELSMEARIE